MDEIGDDIAVFKQTSDFNEADKLKVNHRTSKLSVISKCFTFNMNTLQFKMKF